MLKRGERKESTQQLQTSSIIIEMRSWRMQINSLTAMRFFAYGFISEIHLRIYSKFSIILKTRVLLVSRFTSSFIIMLTDKRISPRLEKQLYLKFTFFKIQDTTVLVVFRRESQGGRNPLTYTKRESFWFFENILKIQKPFKQTKKRCNKLNKLIQRVALMDFHLV